MSALSWIEALAVLTTYKKDQSLMFRSHSIGRVCTVALLMLTSVVSPAFAAGKQIGSAQDARVSKPVDPAGWMGVEGARAERVTETVFGGRIILYRAGRRGAEAVVLIHGLGQTGAKDWSKLIPVLAQRYDVYALDLPGFGESDKGNHLYSPSNFARAIDAVLATRVPSRHVVIGHSLGGAVSLAYAAAYPQRVSRLILVDMAGVLHRSVYAEYLSRLGAQLALGVYPKDAPWLQSLVRSVLTSAESLPVSLGGQVALSIPPLRQRLLGGDPNAIAAYALVEHDFSHALRSISVPTLAIWGSEDQVAPLRTGQMAAALIPGARLLVMQGVGHAPQLQVPERFNAVVQEELSGKLDLAPYALSKQPIQSERAGRCDDERGMRFSGDYNEIVLNKCTDVEIADARVGRLVAIGSDARIANSHIDEGIDAKDSRLEITAGRVGGSTALSLDRSNIDAAGTRFEPSDELARNRGKVPVVLQLSVSEVVEADGAPRYVHKTLHLPPENRRGTRR